MTGTFGRLSMARAAVPPRIVYITARGGWTPRGTFMRPGFAPDAWGHWSDIFRIAVEEGGRQNTDREDTSFAFQFTDPRLTQADMSEVLAPFWDVRDKMVVTEGLAMISSGWDQNGDAHAKGCLAAMSAVPSSGPKEGIKSEPGAVLRPADH